MSPPMPSDPPAQPSGSPTKEGLAELRRMLAWADGLRCSEGDKLVHVRSQAKLSVSMILALLDRLDALERVAETYGALRDGEYKNQCAFDAGFGEVISTAHLQRIADEALRALSAPVPEKSDA